MNKTELIAAVAEQAEMSKKDAEAAVAASAPGGRRTLGSRAICAEETYSGCAIRV